MANEALFTQGGSYDAAELRRLISGIYTAAPPGGVISGLEVTAGVGANVAIAAGHCYVTDGAGGGYMGSTTTSTALALTAFSGSPRTDRIYARILDPGSGATAGEMEINKAQGSTTIPALSIPLADVTVTSSGVTISTAPRVAATARGVPEQRVGRSGSLVGVIAKVPGTGGSVTIPSTSQVLITEQPIGNNTLVTLQGTVTVPKITTLTAQLRLFGLPNVKGSGSPMVGAGYVTVNGSRWGPTGNYPEDHFVAAAMTMNNNANPPNHYAVLYAPTPTAHDLFTDPVNDYNESAYPHTTLSVQRPIYVPGSNTYGQYAGSGMAVVVCFNTAYMVGSQSSYIIAED